MLERKGLITMHGQPLTLLGEEIKVGQSAPDFTVTDNDMKPFRFSSVKGNICVISSVPSLDTPVCDLETRHFNGEAASLGEGVKILTISMDLPFAQKRWCGAHGIEAVKTYSDYRDRSFGQAYGLLIKDIWLLARAVLVVDRNGKVQYTQLVKDLANEPEYEPVFEAAKRLK